MDIEKIYLDGIPALIEKERITIARLPMVDDTPEGSIYLHPRYVPPGKKYETISVYGLRRGRSLSILLDDPIGDEHYHFRKIKGMGSEADREFVIHPVLWFLNDRGWYFIRHIVRYTKTFGAADIPEAVTETTLNGLAHLPTTQVIGQIPFPHSVLYQICVTERCRRIAPLAQIQSLEVTDMRFDQSQYLTDDDKENLLRPIAEGDAKLFLRQRERLKQNRVITLRGHMDENRYIDGRFADPENYDLADDEAAHKLLIDSLGASLRFFGLLSVEYLGLLDGIVDANFCSIIKNGPNVISTNKRLAESITDWLTNPVSDITAINRTRRLIRENPTRSEFHV